VKVAAGESCCSSSQLLLAQIQRLKATLVHIEQLFSQQPTPANRTAPATTAKLPVSTLFIMLIKVLNAQIILASNLLPAFLVPMYRTNIACCSAHARQLFMPIFLPASSFYLKYLLYLSRWILQTLSQVRVRSKWTVIADSENIGTVRYQ
jgi:hypothetical protein